MCFKKHWNGKEDFSRCRNHLFCQFGHSPLLLRMHVLSVAWRFGLSGFGHKKDFSSIILPGTFLVRVQAHQVSVISKSSFISPSFITVQSLRQLLSYSAEHKGVIFVSKNMVWDLLYTKYKTSRHSWQKSNSGTVLSNSQQYQSEEYLDKNSYMCPQLSQALLHHANRYCWKIK